MTYLMSDLHGQYESYRKMLEIIAFSPEDELYVLGDVVDRGPASMELLTDMSMRSNVFPILGNHDYTAAYFLTRLAAEITEETAEGYLTEADISGLSGWLLDGGVPTLEGFRRLTPGEREGILDYLTEFVPYEELSVGGRHFVLVHGGLADFDPRRPLWEYDPRALVTEHTDYTRRYFPDRYLVTGHVPTGLIDPKSSGRIFQGNGHIALDCGNGWGGALGCLRLEDMAEFYV